MTTPSATNPAAVNPSLPQVKTLNLSHPFRGVYRRNSLPQPKGNLWCLHRCSLQDRTLAALPGYIDPNYAMTKMGWAGTEGTRGVINDPSGDDFWVVTDERVQRYPFVADPITSLGNVGSGTAPGGGVVINFAGTTFLSDGLTNGANILADGNYYTLDGVNSDTQLRTNETVAAFTAQPVYLWNEGIIGASSGRYGPRYCWFGTDLIFAGLYGVYRYPFSSTQDYIGAIIHRYRGIDIINFAGRPVVLGAIDTYPADYSSSTAFLQSDMMVWPTRSDVLDWSSYGAGFLYLHSDGSGIRCGETWGEDAYIFTGSSIYQLIETGMSAANPIAFQKHRAKLTQPPISNAVLGNKGIYFWTKTGPAVFDGNTVHDLGLLLEFDNDTWDSDLISAGVHVWVDNTTRTIRFHNNSLTSALLQYIYWEDSGQWTTLDEDDMYLAGTGELYGGKIGIKSTGLGTDTLISRFQKQDQGTEDMSEAAFLCRATWRGIAMEEGPQVNKTIHQIRILFDTVLTGTSLKCSMVGDVHDDTVPDAALIVKTPTPSENLQWAVFNGITTNEYPIWRLDVHFPPGAKIYQICIDYTVAGDTLGPLS